MIFVSMTQDELLERTAQYQIQYSPSSARHRPRYSQIRLQPTHAYFNSNRPPPEERASQHPTVYPSRSQPEPPMSAHFQGFRVTTDFDERSDDEEDRELQEDAEGIEQSLHSQYSQYLDTEPLCSDDDDDEDTEDIPNHGEATYEQLQRALNRANVASRRLDAHTRNMRRRMTPSLIEPWTDGDQIPWNQGESTEVLKPHARFFIQRDKHMVSVKFDPPVYVSSIRYCGQV